MQLTVNNREIDVDILWSDLYVNTNAEGTCCSNASVWPILVIEFNMSRDYLDDITNNVLVYMKDLKLEKRMHIYTAKPIENNRYNVKASLQ